MKSPDSTDSDALRPPASLLEREAAAPFLFSRDALTGAGANEDAVYAVREVAGEFTGERLFLRKPEVYRRVVELLGAGTPVRQVARTLSVSTNTVAAVREREGMAVETARKETVRRLRQFALLGAERLVDEVDKIPLQSLAIAIGIATEKAELLDGGATSRVEHAPQAADDDWWQQVRQVRGEVVVETDVDGETRAPKGGADRLADALAADPCAPVADRESAALLSNRTCATVSGTAAAPQAAQNEGRQGSTTARGGEGGAPADGGVDRPNDTRP